MTRPLPTRRAQVAVAGRLRASALLLAVAPVVLAGCAPREPAPAGTDAPAAPVPSAAAAAVAEGRAAWHTLPEGEGPMLRHEHGYVEVGGRFFLIGGRGERPVEEFDPATGRWTRRATPPLEMHHFQAVAYDGRIYVLGALTGGWPNEPPIPHVYIYDPAADRWERGPEVPEARRRGAAGVVVHDGEIFLVSGIQVGHSSGHVPWLDAFDPRTGRWRVLADAPRARDHFHAVVLDGRLYAVGGRRSSAATNQPFQLTVAEVDVYDFATDRWTTLPAASNLPTERAGTATVAWGGRVVVLGGESGSQVPAHDEVEALDPATGRWTALPRLNQGRHGAQAVLHDGRIWIAAGSRVRGANEIRSQEVFPTPP
jgi:hypothetical protein